ncbi:GNAT family N-acetyltransferase [Runella slithyformis]|uniref:Gcn5-related N-acetyltransferase n=1 Tax=Runella slithyformis (strain ATCC 29530 / DSM 19594 / LMG 11500 / NCIMB 11436 / LSU 4) TaxID=761193 RepID=A0A7U3ZG01_RUNSL|nr:GNAT family N-acetyltransferase [Runella slithyformis]AEI46545.1 gcn5-related N-acetyltransferase [Runella slithyformis DSM 19594]
MGQIKHSQTDTGGAFYYESDGQRLAAMTYVDSGKKTILIDHTEVNPSLQGQGIGKKLQAELVAYVRKNDIKVVPVCRFATATFRKMPEWQDVLS